MTGSERAGSERGAGVLLAVLVLFGSLLVAAAGGLGLSYAAAARAARTSVDLAALSGAQAHARGEDACEEAGRIAARNAVELTTCEVTGDGIDYVVHARVARTLGWRVPGLPGVVRADAYAGSVSGVP